MLNRKISIVTDKSQTTRNNIKGIYTTDDAEIVFVDTPGIHKPKQKLGEEMDKMAFNSLSDVDAVILVVDAGEKFGPGDSFLIDKIKDIKTPLFVVFLGIGMPRNQKK